MHQTHFFDTFIAGIFYAILSSKRQTNEKIPSYYFTSNPHATGIDSVLDYQASFYFMD